MRDDVPDGKKPSVRELPARLPEQMDPLVSAQQRARVLGLVDGGRRAGARLVVGGTADRDHGAGFFVRPTLFDGVTNDMPIAHHEIFGPVLCVLAVDVTNMGVIGLPWEAREHSGFHKAHGYEAMAEHERSKAVSILHDR
jgi:acyl-CoA reductase-like NAD-dependent aldehyde dehydrogenase